MVDYAQLRNLDTSKLTSAAEAAGGLSGTLSTRGTEVDSSAEIPTGMWQGADATAAQGMMSPLSSPLYDVSDVANRSKGVLETLVDDLTAAKNRLDDAHDLAASEGLVIGGDGSVTVPPTNDAADYQQKKRIATQVSGIIDEAVKQANDSDSSAGGSLASAGGTTFGAEVGNFLKDTLGPKTSGPLGNHAWTPWAMQQLAGRTGTLASIRKEQLKRFAPRGANGRFVSPKNMSKWEKAKASAKGKNFIPKAGNKAALAKWTKVGNYAKGAGGVVTAGAAGVTDVVENWNNPNMSTGDKVGSAALTTGVEGGGAVAGGLGGAKVGAAAGAAIGSVVPGAGTAAGAVIGGAVGGIGGSIAGGKAGGWAVDKINPFD